MGPKNIDVQRRRDAIEKSGPPLSAWIQEQGYLGFFYDAAEMLLRPIEQLVIEVDQHPDHHDNAKYINNFFFVAASDARAVIDQVHRSIHKPNLN
jgi:hypothetical protein